nr:nuclear transport factor 2 family protein [uncultured Duganella sp.]
MKRYLAATSLALSLYGVAHAGQASNDANTHFQAIASGDLSVLMRGYNDTAQLQWLGGPLDGSYNGAANIRGVWEKFGKAQGPLKATIEALEESANPKGATVTANVLFVGKAPIKVRYVLVYRDNLIVSETWQIDPKLNVGPVASAPVAAAPAVASAPAY